MCSTPLSAAAEAFKDSSQGWRGHLPVAQRQDTGPHRTSPRCAAPGCLVSRIFIYCWFCWCSLLRLPLLTSDDGLIP